MVGGFLIDESRLPALAAIGVKDSKLLTPQGRNGVFSGLAAIGERVHVKIPPRTVDRWVARNGLNELEAQAFGRLVRWTRPDVTYVDACDPVAWRFGGRVRRWARTDRPIVALHHADRDLLVVGAASVVAKVHRDRAIASLARRLGQEIGTAIPAMLGPSPMSAPSSPTGPHRNGCVTRGSPRKDLSRNWRLLPSTRSRYESKRPSRRWSIASTGTRTAPRRSARN